MDAPPLISPPAPAYKDRRAGLIFFGVMGILFGCFFLLSAPAAVLGQIAAANKAQAGLSPALVLTSLFTPAMLAAALIWLGIGSIKARRWARAILLCLGWIGLCMGAASLPVVIMSLGSLEDMLQQQGQNVAPVVLTITKVVMVATTTVLYVVIPAALVLFYRSPHVKHTCEKLDPVERWTDRCPLPVIAICLLQAYGAFSMLTMMAQFGAAFPLAGFVVTGWPSWILWLGFVGFSLYAAWGFYHLRYRAWLIYTTVVMLLGISSVVTFLRIDLLDYYRMSGFPEWQINQIAASPLFRRHMMVWLSLVGIILLGGYLAYLRRYFLAPRPSPDPVG